MEKKNVGTSAPHKGNNSLYDVHSAVSKIDTYNNNTPFPTALFPEPIKKFISEAGKALPCPDDFIALPVLCVASTVIGNSKSLEVKKGWYEGANLYCGIVADPGSKKSPALNLALAPLYEIQQNNAKAYDNSLAFYESQEMGYQIELDSWYKKAKIDNSLVDEKPQPPMKPIYKQVITSDSTLESLIEVLKNNERGILKVHDELVAFVKSMNQYRAGADRQHWLSMWSQHPIHVNRKGKDPIEIKKPFCTVLGGIQPAMLEELLKGEKEMGGGDGFLDRFLFLYPEPMKPLWSDHEVSESTIKQYHDIIMNIYNTSSEEQIVQMNHNAKQMYIDWYNTVVEEMDSPYVAASLKGVLAKVQGMCARIILILHTLRWACNETPDELLVDEETVMYSCYLMEHLKEHLYKVHKAVYSSEYELRVQKINEFVTSKGDTVQGGKRINANLLNQGKVFGRKTSKDLIRETIEAMERENLGEVEIYQVHNGFQTFFTLFHKED